MPNDLDNKYKAMLMLWFGIAMSIGGLFAVTVFAAPEALGSDRDVPAGFALFAMAGVGTLLVVLSFAVKRKLLQRSVEKQDVMLVQQAMIAGCAMCEVSALLGVAERFLIGSGDHYLLFLVSAIGIALHFPRRDHVLAASWNEETRRQL